MRYCDQLSSHQGRRQTQCQRFDRGYFAERKPGRLHLAQHTQTVGQKTDPKRCN